MFRGNSPRCPRGAHYTVIGFYGSCERGQRSARGEWRPAGPSWWMRMLRWGRETSQHRSRAQPMWDAQDFSGRSEHRPFREGESRSGECSRRSGKEMQKLQPCVITAIRTGHAYKENKILRMAIHGKFRGAGRTHSIWAERLSAKVYPSVHKTTIIPLWVQFSYVFVTADYCLCSSYLACSVGKIWPGIFCSIQSIPAVFLSCIFFWHFLQTNILRARLG